MAIQRGIKIIFITFINAARYKKLKRLKNKKGELNG